MLAPRFLIRLINLVTDIVVGLLGLRIVLKILGASTAAPFVTWVYDTTRPLLTPFQGMFPSPELAPRLTLEFSAVFAIVVYSFVGYILSDIVRTMSPKADSGGKK
ncbi:MAG: hypothetical protein ACD_13C00110G0002 [uncultured bacterium]|nr:MAG: hypothetical protein ACD_13C00110G0002 [uncultured bacterium]KKR56667.1 MAG: hypothetical protein UT96_C0037G0008 [Candidatus Woesebacteria bacterium GW2011_GWC2_40_30]HAU65164.1 hypothetical protein [Candidatus Woesebacteria bacterium]HCC09140.1 hypothetical protein [Candidatus Woesebacteria bacterium]